MDMMKLRLIITILAMLPLSSYAQDYLAKATLFLSLLDETLQSKAQYSFEDEERLNWDFVPHTRNGVRFHDLNEKQKEAAIALMKASLSAQGYKKAADILALEALLRQAEGRGENDTYRDPMNYYFTIFGTPASDQVWGWRIEGHHLSLNFSSVKGIIESSTPSFMGANPAVVKTGVEKGKAVLKQETDLGFLLVNSLSPTQLKEAKFTDRALPEIVSGNNQKVESLEPKGISFTSLTEDQKKILLQLLDVYIKNYQMGFANKLMKKIEASGLENLSFAWAGGLQPGSGHYYRIQGPMLLIEYDNTQNNANHVHTVVRDLTNDFAEDILREHYAKEHQR